MGGSYFLYDDAEDDDDDYALYDEKAFSYSYSGFHWMKGEVLRAAIRRLEMLQTAKQDPEGALQFYVDAGIKVGGAQTDQEAVDNATRNIRRALSVLNRWVREQQGRDRFDTPFSRLMGGGLARAGLVPGDLELLAGMRSGNPPDMDDMLDNNYRSQRIASLVSCPKEVVKVGMRGLYEFMKLADTGQEIFPREAKAISEMIDKALPCLGSTLNEHERDAVVTMVTELRDLCNVCTGDRVIRG